MDLFKVCFVDGASVGCWKLKQKMQILTSRSCNVSFFLLFLVYFIISINNFVNFLGRS